jgi:AcrR family transcriptional regulator
MNRQEKKKDTVERIINAALKLFDEKGYDAATVAEIAAAAGVARGTFFNYFKTKDDLLMTFQKGLFFSRMEGPGEISAPYAPWILAHAKEAGDIMENNRTMLRLSLQRFLSTAATEGGRCAIFKNVEAMIPIFEKGQQAGEFTKAATPRAMAMAAMRIYFGTLCSWCTGVEDGSLGDQLFVAFQLFLNGIVSR